MPRALAQGANSTSTSYTYDLNGQRVPGAQQVETVANGTVTRSQRTESINGRMVPREKVEERVVRQDGNHKVVERLVYRYSLTGELGSPEKQIVDEEKRPDGSSTVRTTVYRGDLNGQLQLAQRTTTDTRKQGSTVNAETLIERPTANSALELVERVQRVEQLRGDAVQETSETYRKDNNGQFYQAVREVKDQETKNNVVTVNTAEYELGSTGQMQLHSQTVRKSTKSPNGSEQEQIDVFGPSVPGTSRENGGPLALQEQQTIQRRPAGNGSVVETVSVRRPTVSDPTHLGDARQISETVCTGKCAGGGQP